MIRSIPRRTVLVSLAGMSAAMLLASCGDKDEGDKAKEAPKPAEPAAEAPKPAEPAAAPAPATPAPPTEAAAPEPQGSVDMAELLKPGALPEKFLGKADAPVTIVEYASMTCPHCAHFHETTLPELTKKYIDTGKVRLIFREFPFDPRAEAGFMLARCSEDKYFPMLDVLFSQQANWVGVEDAKVALLQISKLAGFSQETFEACLTNQKLLDEIRAVKTRGADTLKVDSTPTFFINGKTYKGAMSIAEMSAIIDPLL
jgi:protein-disulfide isomerase